MLPLDKLEQLSRRYLELDDLLCDPRVLADRHQLSKLNKERTDIEAIVQAFGRYRELEKKIREDEEALTDPELRELVELELPELQKERSTLEGQIQLLLLPTDPNDK